MCFSSAGRTKEENVFPFLDKATGVEFAHHRSIDGMIEGKIKVFNGLTGIGMSEQALKLPIAAGLEGSSQGTQRCSIDCSGLTSSVSPAFR